MALNLDAVGKKIGPVSKDYNWKDVILYALGVGAGFEELDHVYEKNLKVVPSFAVAAIFDFLSYIGTNANVDLSGILHGEQDLIVHRPIPTGGTLTTEGAIRRIYDNGRDKGAVIVGEGETRHSDGHKLCTNVITLVARKDGGFGGEPAPRSGFTMPEREPDFVVEAHPSPDQPLLYRLSGDLFALHVDPEFAKLAGFERPIMHGLCTHGFACRALISSLIPGEPEKLRRMKCRFSSPLYPGDPIQTRIWKTEENQAVWQTVNAKTGEVTMNNGVFEYGEPQSDQIRFDGRVAVITGAGGGLGRVYALDLAERGAKVVVNDLGGARDGTGSDATPADKVVEEIRAMGGEAVANYDNVTSAEGGENIIRSALEAFGTVDILVNNAGILRDKSLVKMDPENWQPVIDVHLTGAYNVTRPAFRVMREKGYGRIIMTTSAAGLYGNFGQSNYSAAKMGLVGFMNSLKLEGAKYNIHVNTVAPLAVSRLTRDILPPDMHDKMRPEFVSPMVLYLCSDQCTESGYIYNAGMCVFNRASIVTGPATTVGDGVNPPSVEAVRDSMDTVNSLGDAKEYRELNEQVADIINACSRPDTGGEDAGGRASSVADVFAAMEQVFDPEAAKGVHAVFQYRISGDAGGDWYCVVEDGTCSISAGVHDNPTCTLKIRDSDFLDMIKGTLPAMQAYTSGKLQIEGDIMKSQLIGKLFHL
ncbi:MAG TPA: SDR family NAD(P)-dependent oxidoreductase [Desulfosalsimonadaceae bacterium]|nr:SDR family NAD(P)-dependent oxidoreductase [Desulfosalsimonadaceae bacterium]